MADNFRLADHNVEMDYLGEDMDTLGMVRFEAAVDDGTEAQAYVMNKDKWTAAGEPQTIYITVTSVIKTDEPADGVEVHRSAETGEFVSEEFAERNPSTTIKQSIDG